MNTIQKEKEKIKQISFKIPVQLYKEIKHSSIDNDMTIKDMFIEF